MSGIYLAEIRRITGVVDSPVQLIYHERDAFNNVVRKDVRTYDGEVARLLGDVIEYLQRNEVQS